MVLIDSERMGVFKRFAGELSDSRIAFGLSKPAIRAAIIAIDNWVEANQASFNAAIPQPAKAALTAKQKARLLFHIVARRYEVEP